MSEVVWGLILLEVKRAANRFFFLFTFNCKRDTIEAKSNFSEMYMKVNIGCLFTTIITKPGKEKMKIKIIFRIRLFRIFEVYISKEKIR